MADRVSQRGNRKTVKFRGMFLWIIVFYFYNIFLPMHFRTNGYQRFLWTNSTDPMQLWETLKGHQGQDIADSRGNKGHWHLWAACNYRSGMALVTPGVTDFKKLLGTVIVLDK